MAAGVGSKSRERNRLFSRVSGGYGGGEGWCLGHALNERRRKGTKIVYFDSREVKEIIEGDSKCLMNDDRRPPPSSQARSNMAEKTWL